MARTLFIGLALLLIAGQIKAGSNYTEKRQLPFQGPTEIPKAIPRYNIGSIPNPTPTKILTLPQRHCGFAGESVCVRPWECITEQKQNGPRMSIYLNNNSICHYLEVCCHRSRTLKKKNPYKVINIPMNNPNCGINNDEGLYMTIEDANDNEANFGEYPWSIAVFNGNSDKYLCAGALINPKVVLTTAECLNSGNSEAKFTARGGDWDLATTNELFRHQEIKVKTAIRHEHFNINNLENNIAILILEHGFHSRDYIRSICLPQAALKLNKTECVATAWNAGPLEASRGNQHILKEQIMSLIDDDEVKSNELKAYSNGSSLTYAIGAPLACPSQSNQYYLEGLWSKDRGDLKTPAAFTDVKKFVHWISRILLRNGILI